MKEEYDDNNNPIKKYESKLFPYENNRKELEDYFYKKHGNGWWYYLDCPQDSKKRQYWINKFRKEGV